MNALDTILAERLEDLRAKNLLRRLRRVDSPQSVEIQAGGRRLLNFSSNDYLGLADDPLLKDAAAEAIRQFGAGAGASRLISGSLAPHHELEEALARFKQTEAALTFSSGYAAAVGTICALVGPGDVILLDKLVHASIVDAARLSRARLRVFAHNDVDDLDRILQFERSRIQAAGSDGQILVATESVFSMDGDQAPLRELVAVKEKSGAWLMVDEAHATGILGPNGRGLAAEFGVDNRIEVQMGTLGKALGTSGGFICGSRRLIDYLVHRARSFLFSTAPAPATAAAATAALQLIQSQEGETRRRRLIQRITELHSRISITGAPASSAIVPVILGEELLALQAAEALLEGGIFVPAIRYPTVRRGAARLRITLCATHTPEHISTLARALRQIPSCAPPAEPGNR